MTSIYLIGSLRNPDIPSIGNALRKVGYDVFDDWHAAGQTADDEWRDYEKIRGRDYASALSKYAATHTFSHDHFHLNYCHAAVLSMPAGKSGHLEAGYVAGLNKPVFLLLESNGDPERLDVMAKFFQGVYYDIPSLCNGLSKYPWPKLPNMPEQIHVSDAIWLAGLLEGEGSFCISEATPRCVLQMTDYDIVERAAKILHSSVWKGKTTKGGKQVWGCGVAGLRACEWMRILKPYLGHRRRAQILDTVQKWLERKRYRKQDENWWRKVFGCGM